MSTAEQPTTGALRRNVAAVVVAALTDHAHTGELLHGLGEAWMVCTCGQRFDAEVISPGRVRVGAVNEEWKAHVAEVVAAALASDKAAAKAEMLLPLAAVLAGWKDGDERGWQAEFDYLWSEHTGRMDMLTTSIQETGIREPIHLGSDGRVWDGHHRLAAADRLALSHVPVRLAVPSQPGRDASTEAALTEQQRRSVAHLLRRVADRHNRRPETRDACLTVADALWRSTPGECPKCGGPIADDGACGWNTHNPGPIARAGYCPFCGRWRSNHEDDCPTLAAGGES